MAPSSSSIPTTIDLKKDGTFLDGKLAAGIALRVENLPGVASAIKNNTQFPADAVIDLQGGLSAKTGDIKFGNKATGTTVTFKAGAKAGLFVATSAEGLAKTLKEQDILAAIKLPVDGVARYAALYWGYDIAGALKGSVALGFGAALKFGVDGKTSGDFVVVRAFAKDPKARDAMDSLLTAWRLPKDVVRPSDLEPGTWIAAEVDGEFAASIGAQFGYDYSWVRKITGANLSGDIGLKIQAAAAVTLGFSAAGKYLAVVGRESLDPASNVLRVRVSKLNRKGFSFALDASAKITTSTGKLLPRQLDDFVRAIFGLHGPQIVKDLGTFRDWINPATPLPEKFASFVSHYAVQKLGAAAGPQIDAARKQVQSLLDAWDNLPSKLSALLWDRVREAGFGELETWLRNVAKADKDAIRKEIDKALGTANFFSTLPGQWITAAIDGPLLDATLESATAGKVKDLARKTLAALDGGVLSELKTFVDERVGLDAIRKAVKLADPENLEPWLETKLAEFIGKSRLDLKGLEQVREALHTFLAKGDQLYEAALEALNRDWAFSFHYEYARTTEKTALFDASFDFDAGAGMETELANALNGDWRSLLLTEKPGVTLHTATLTHAIKRTSHVEITLPYFNNRIDRVTESIARMDVVNDGSRLLLYDLHASDEVRARNKWRSALTVSGKIGAGAAGVRDFSSESAGGDFRYSYSLRIAAEKVRTSQLERRMQQVAGDLFPDAFKITPLHEWAIDIDKLADAADPTPNGSGNVGNVLASLDVSAPGRAVAAWLKAPRRSAADLSPYAELSKRMQRVLRRMTPMLYFDSIEKYTGQEIKIAAPLLVYSCLPLGAPKLGRDGRPDFAQPADPIKRPYWDITNQDLKLAMINYPSTIARLGAEMAGIHKTLEDHRNKFAGDYNPTDTAAVGKLLQLAAGSRHFDSLLMSERESIEGAIRAGLQMAEFVASANNDPEAALESMAEFGESLTRTFNSKLSNLFVKNSLRELGTVVFLEASRAFDPELANARTRARLAVTLLRSSAPDKILTDFVAGKEPDVSMIAIQQPIIGGL